MSRETRSEKIMLWCDRVMCVGLCLFIYFMPISIVVVEYSFGFAFLSYAFKRSISFHLCLKKEMPTSIFQKMVCFLKSFRPVYNKLNLPIAAFVLVNFLSIFISQYPGLSTRAFVFKVLQGAFFYITFIECMTHRRRIKIFMMIFLVSATLISINGIFQLLTGEGFIFGHSLNAGRVRSSFRHANDFGGYLVVVCLLLLNSLVTLPKFFNKEKMRKGISQGRIMISYLIFIVLFFLFLFCLGFTFSRGAWISFFLGLIVLFSYQGLKWLLIPFFVICFFSVIFFPKLEETRRVSIITDRVVEKTSRQPSPSLSSEEVPVPNGLISSYRQKIIDVIEKAGGSGRRGFWNEALSIIKEYPFLGTGVNTYSLVVQKYKINWGGYPHNSYLQMAAEIGIIGLFSFLWILWALFKEVILSIRKKSDHDFILALLMGSSSGLLGFLFHSGLDTNFYSVQLGNFMWVMFGFIMALQRLSQRPLGS